MEKKPNAFISQKIYDEYRKKFSFPKKGDVLLSASGTIGRRVIYNGEPAYFQDSNIIWIDNDESKILNKFCIIYMQQFNGKLKVEQSKDFIIIILIKSKFQHRQ